MEESQVTTRDGATELAEELMPAGVGIVVVGGGEDMCPPRLLCFVHGRVGPAHERGERITVGWIDGDAGRGRGLHRHGIDGDRRLEARRNRLRDRCRRAGVRRIDHHCELVTAEPSDE